MTKNFKKIILLFFIVITPALFLSLTGTGFKAADSSAIFSDSLKILEPELKHSKASSLIARLILFYHYKKVDVDDSLSTKIFDKYIESLDYNKTIFIKSDIEGFQQYRYNFDEFILDGYLQTPFQIYNLFSKRLTENIKHVFELIETEFDYSIDENYYYDRKNEPWFKSEAETREHWRKRIKNEALSLKLAGKEWSSIQETLRKRYTNYMKAVSEYNAEDVFQIFMNSFTESIDPHSNYFSPISSENFKISMSRSLEGIGATLTSEGDYTVVREVVPGGPAATSGFVKRNDKIVAVAQGEEGDYEDVIGWRLDDVVQKIRGAKGTIVRLQIISEDMDIASPPKEIKLIRDKIKLEEQSAKKKLVKIKNGGKEYKIGVITVPAFYIDFEGRRKGEEDYKSATRDVKRLLDTLKEEGVDGILIDLRNNGGGGLLEAIELTGLFIKNGPVVQVRQADGKIEVGADNDPYIAYDGPMAVLVNRFSASASEIFAAAIQDYNRGIVIGENTFGKGTVQDMIDLNTFIKNSSDKYGQLKITIAKYYRIDGGSTQNRGVMPDIDYPSAFSPEEFGESSEFSALPWDKIRGTAFSKYGDLSNIAPSLIKKHRERILKDKDFKEYLESIENYKKSRDKKFVSLNEDIRRKELEENKKKKEKPEAEELLDESFDYELLAGTESKDPALKEAEYILSDFINVKRGIK